MGRLVFVGLGLNKETDMSLRGLEEARTADVVFAELYTSLMPELNLEKLEELIGKGIETVSRRNLEEENGSVILDKAEKGTAVLLVPGDPLIATTHIELRIRAEKKGVKTTIVHGPSIISAVVGLSGLQNYKFGRSVTIPFSDGTVSETPYNVLAENQKAGVHTLCFLDIRAEEKKYMSIKKALEMLLYLESTKHRKVINAGTLAVGIARAGSENPKVKADYAGELLKLDFGKPPHSLVLPGKLHFMESEALITLAHAPEKIREITK